MSSFLDSEKIYIIGGVQNGNRSERTWIIDPKNNYQAIEGPPMNEARAWHCSGQMQINGKIYIIVAGGHCKNSIEILDPSLSDQRWIYGERLKFFQCRLLCIAFVLFSVLYAKVLCTTSKYMHARKERRISDELINYHTYNYKLSVVIYVVYALPNNVRMYQEIIN